MKIEQVEADFVVLVWVVLLVQGIWGERKRRRKKYSGEVSEIFGYFIRKCVTVWTSPLLIKL